MVQQVQVKRRPTEAEGGQESIERAVRLSVGEECVSVVSAISLV